ncbi:MAG: DUF885 domain-containing protein [Pseudomonadota bacterium]
MTPFASSPTDPSKRRALRRAGAAPAAIALVALLFAACGGADAPQTNDAASDGAADTADGAAELQTNAAPTPEPLGEASLAFLESVEEHARAFLQIYPEGATTLGVSARIAGAGYLERWADYGPDGAAQMRALNARFREELAATARADLSGVAASTYDVLQNAYALAERRNGFAFGGGASAGASAPQVGASWATTPYFVTQLSGPHLVLPRLLQTQQPLATRAHVEAYIARLAGFDAAFDGVVATVRADAAKGVTPPLFTVEAVVASARRFVDKPATEHPLTETLIKKMAGIDALTPEERDAFAARAVEAVETSVYPAYEKLAVAFEGLRDKAGEDAGVWRLGDKGRAFYQLALDAYGGGGKTPDEIHDVGLAEVSRITAEMDAILKALGLAEGAVGARMAGLAAEDGGVYPNTDEGREALLASLREQVAEVNALAPDWFATLPRQKVEVRRIPAHEQDNAPGGYYSGPSLDGSRPGIYWINLKNTADSPKYGLKTLTYHEAVPGHHFQISLQRAIDDMPLMRNLLSYSEYAEGWALYGEALAKEMGLYDDDPQGDLGRLQAELFRAARLVVDTGLHSKKWSREEAIDYMVRVTGESEASATREVERYAAIPGQACSYKLGMLRIQEMRARAEAELGDAFDIRAFHDALLLAGAMPMDALDARVSRWIADAKS